MTHRFNLSDWTLHHRTLVGFFLFAIALMGIIAYARLSQAEDPPFTFKLMVIRSFWPGATAEQVELQLTDKIEKKLQETPYIDRVQSFSRAGESTVMVRAGQLRVSPRVSTTRVGVCATILRSSTTISAMLRGLSAVTPGRICQ